MRIFKKHLFTTLFALASVLLVSCGDDEPQVDKREQAVGSYSVNLEYVDASGNTISDNFTASISKAGDNNLQFTADGETETLIGVNEAGNGLAFNIENSTDTDAEGDTYSNKGTKSISLGGEKYDGRYSSDNGEFFLQIEYVYVNRDYEAFDAVITFSGFKK